MENIKIKGHVQIFTETGELVVDEDNMVVESGRLAVRDAFLNGTRYSFSRILLGVNGSITTPDMGISNIQNPIEFSITEQPSVSSDINEPLCLSLEFKTANYNQYANFKELGLTIKNGENEILFSRVVFAGYPFTKDHSYMMKYSVYF